MSHSVEKRKISVSDKIRCCQEQTYGEGYSILIGVVFCRKNLCRRFLIGKNNSRVSILRNLLLKSYNKQSGTRWRSWLGHFATSHIVACSIPDGIIWFFFLNFSGHNVALVWGRGEFVVGKPEGKRPLGRPRRRWEDNIEMDLQEVGGSCGALVGTVRNLRVPKMRGISWLAAEPVSFSRRTLFRGVSK